MTFNLDLDYFNPTSKQGERQYVTTKVKWYLRYDLLPSHFCPVWFFVTDWQTDNITLCTIWVVDHNVHDKSCTNVSSTYPARCQNFIIPLWNCNSITIIQQHLNFSLFFGKKHKVGCILLMCTMYQYQAILCTTKAYIGTELRCQPRVVDGAQCRLTVNNITKLCTFVVVHTIASTKTDRQKVVRMSSSCNLQRWAQ